MKTKLFNLLAIGTVILLISCGKKEEQDTTAPVVSKLTINGKEDHIHVHPGDTLFVVIDFEDNVELKSGKVEIHGDDGHTHKIAATEFTYSNILSLSGKNQQINLIIPVPDPVVTGAYHFTVRAVDGSGNESPLKVREIEIEDEH